MSYLKTLSRRELLKTSIENQQQIMSLSNQIYNTNNDGYITFNHDSVISSVKTPMYILPEFHPTPNVLIPADVDHFKIVNKNNDNNKNNTNNHDKKYTSDNHDNTSDSDNDNDID